MGCIMERLPQGTVKEEMGTEGQRKFSPMVTSMVESGFHEILHFPICRESDS